MNPNKPNFSLVYSWRLANTRNNVRRNATKCTSATIMLLNNSSHKLDSIFHEIVSKVVTND